MNNEYKGFLIERNQFNLRVIRKAGRGGSAPKSLRGCFSTIVHAENAIDSHLAEKANGSSKG